MATLGAELTDVVAGRVVIALPIEPRLSQHDGFLHAGVVVAALDSACGYAALTLMSDDAEVLTVALKANLLAPASGDRLVAEGEVVRAGGTLTVCRGDAYAEQGAERVHVATIAGDDGASAGAVRVVCISRRTASPIVSWLHANSSCNGISRTPVTERNPEEMTSARNATAATFHA
jgi:uncharacterized protein (TIGR00369 family)